MGRRTKLAMIIAVGVGVLTGCAATAAPATDPSPVVSDSAGPTSPNPRTPAAPTASPEVSDPSPAPTTSNEPDPDEVRLTITIADGKVTPSGEKVDVRRGQTVVMSVVSDVEEEIHAHTAGEGFSLDVRAGEKTTGSFVAADRGRFEVELHESGDVIAILNVR